jgi:predicted naringenin-chalcone synthase
MFITGLGTATPTWLYSQAECWDALQRAPQFSKLNSRSRALAKKVLLGKNGISTRHLAFECLEDAFELSPDALHGHFRRHAPPLAAQAAIKALARASLNPREVDALIISTCTGYLCPGLTSYVSEALGLRPDGLLLDLVGQGCGAALPNLATAAALVESRRCEHVLSVCVEVCSAAFYLDDDPGVLISACLFADGAGAAVMSSRAKDHSRRVEWKKSTTELDPSSRDLLRFEQRDGMLRNILMPQVPTLAAAAAKRVLAKFSEEIPDLRSQITTWIWHAGGRDVLVALRDQLALDEADLCWSAVTLRELGNISSPFVLHVLERALNQGAAPGLWWLSSFGAGFCCHGALLQIE